MKIAIIIPCFNEENAIKSVLNEIDLLKHQHTNHTFIAIPINDCSTDNTLGVLRQTTATYLNLPINLGIGGAVQTGLKYATENGFDIALQLDGDGQHPTNQILALVLPIVENQADVVIGSRFIEKTGFQSTSMRRGGINIIKKTIFIFTGRTISDPTSGFRAYNLKAFSLLSKDYPDDFPEPVALIPLIFSGLVVKEIPVIMRDRTTGTSSIKNWKSIYYMIKVVLAIAFNYLKYKSYGKRSSF